MIALGQTLREAAPASPGGRVGTFTVVERGHALPTSGARDQMVAAMRGSPIAFTLVVYEESGFVAAAIRGFLTGISLLVGPALPIHLSATVAEGALWVEKNAPPTRWLPSSKRASASSGRSSADGGSNQRSSSSIEVAWLER